MNEEIYYKKLVERYRSKKASDEELIVFFHLLNEGLLDPYLGDSFMHAAEITGPAGVLHKPESDQFRPVKKLWPRIAMVAAVISIVLMVVFLYMEKPGPSSQLGKGDGAGEAKITYASVSTSHGQQRELMLPDGSRIWLNAASSIRYPVAFTDSVRIVELEGECFFQVAKDAAKPFKVRLQGGVEIRVLGTQFNVHAYRDELISATLLEGSIQMHSSLNSTVLKPGQEALVEKSGNLKVGVADLDETLAWKNGLFQFNRANITTVMKQLEKWYGVEVVYEGEIPEKQFVGKISRNSDITEVLEILRLSKINFRIEGKKVTIIP